MILLNKKIYGLGEKPAQKLKNSCFSFFGHIENLSAKIVFKDKPKLEKDNIGSFIFLKKIDLKTLKNDYAGKKSFQNIAFVGFPLPEKKEKKEEDIDWE